MILQYSTNAYVKSLYKEWCSDCGKVDKKKETHWHLGEIRAWRKMETQVTKSLTDVMQSAIHNTSKMLFCFSFWFFKHNPPPQKKKQINIYIYKRETMLFMCCQSHFSGAVRNFPYTLSTSQRRPSSCDDYCCCNMLSVHFSMLHFSVWLTTCTGMKKSVLTKEWL